ncbi:hypothetical protein [uncultured Flavobacterium sp.]|uniref:hypothetical protein n=1 Tax=uncultured Flavobacterium sp. TaxID=165435 RepID=UPI0025D8C419|nr:hypothetical protein [uncultured Flavobacterium sp.]
MKKIIYTLIICISLISCNSEVSKEQLTSKVRNDINVELQKRATTTGITLTINSFDLLHKKDKEYSGILKTTEGGQEYTYQVDVTVDGDSYMWKIVP